jgi:hypothetical protein
MLVCLGFPIGHSCQFAIRHRELMIFDDCMINVNVYVFRTSMWKGMRQHVWPLLGSFILGSMILRMVSPMGVKLRMIRCLHDSDWLKLPPSEGTAWNAGELATISLSNMAQSSVDRSTCWNKVLFFIWCLQIEHIP